MSKKGKNLKYQNKQYFLANFLFALSTMLYFCTEANAQTPLRANSGASPVTPVNKSSPNEIEKNNSSDIDRVIAIVNREIITEQELKARINLITQQFLEAKKPLPSKEIVQKEVLERLIDESIIYQESSIYGVRILEQEMDNILANMANQKNQTVEELRKATEKSGINWEKFKQNIRREIIISRFRERAVESKIKITDAEIEAFINSQIKRPQAADTVIDSELIDIAQILVPIPTGASNSEILALKTKAQEIFDQANKEPEFMKFANQLSAKDKLIRVQDLGYRSLDRLPQIFVDATKDASSDTLVPKVIQTAAGFHILKVLDRKSSGSNNASGSTNSDSIFITQYEINLMLLAIKQGVSEDDVVRKLKLFRDQIKAKTSKFEDIALKYSEDPNVASNKGYLGWISPGQVPPEIDVALSRLNPGEVSEPFQTEFGWHIVQLINRRQTEVTGAQQKEYARANLRQIKLVQATSDWLRELRDNATIELRPPYTMSK